MKQCIECALYDGCGYDPYADDEACREFITDTNYQKIKENGNK